MTCFRPTFYSGNLGDWVFVLGAAVADAVAVAGSISVVNP